MSYEASLKHKRDAESVYNSALKAGRISGHAQGVIEGKIEGKIEGERKKAIETAINLKKMDISIEKISKATGLSIEEVEQL